MPEPGFYLCLNLIGGGLGALDKLDGSVLNDKDGAIVITESGTYTYFLDNDSGAAENSPFVISPNNNAGNKRWILKSSDVKETVTVGSPTLSLLGVTKLDSSGGAITGTLADGAVIGGIKTIIMTDATTSSTITVAHHVTSDPEVFTFAQVGDTLILVWNGTDWLEVHNTGAAV